MPIRKEIRLELITLCFRYLLVVFPGIATIYLSDSIDFESVYMILLLCYLFYVQQKDSKWENRFPSYAVEGTRLIKEHAPSMIILILTTFDDDEFIVKALQHGAGGYMLKNIPPEQIASGIRTVHSGNMLIHPDIAKKLGGLLHPVKPVQSSAASGKRRLTTA